MRHRLFVTIARPKNGIGRTRARTAAKSQKQDARYRANGDVGWGRVAMQGIVTKRQPPLRSSIRASRQNKGLENRTSNSLDDQREASEAIHQK